MINRTLSKRLARLETRLALEGEPLILQIEFVSSDGAVEQGPRFCVPGGGRPQAEPTRRRQKSRKRHDLVRRLRRNIMREDAVCSR